MISTTKNKILLLKNIVAKIVLPIVLILLTWHISSLLIDNSFILPGLSETAGAMGKIISKPDFLMFIIISNSRVLAGLLLGTLIGIILATLSYYFQIANSIISPVMSILKATPVACIIVLLWISMNYTELTVFVTTAMVLPIIWQNLLDGYKSISNDLKEVVMVYDLSFKKQLKVMIIPSLLSYLFPALITSVGLAWKAEIAAEIMTNSNIGDLIFNFKTVSYDTASIFAWTIIIISLSLLFEYTTKFILKRIMHEYFS